MTTKVNPRLFKGLSILNFKKPYFTKVNPIMKLKKSTYTTDQMDSIKQAGLLDMQIAEKYLHTEDKGKAWESYKQAADRLYPILKQDKDAGTSFISVALQLSSLSFILGKGFSTLAKYLHRAHEIAQTIGDRRSHAMLNMHLGRLYYFSDRRADAMVALSVGLSEIEELGDEDILEQSAEFLGTFYFMQGLFKEALTHLERAERALIKQEKGQLHNPLTPILLGYCLTYLGEFHRAIGALDFHWRMARERSDHNLAMTLRIILGTVLILIKRGKEGSFHIDETIKEARIKNNYFAEYLAAGPIAMRYLTEGHATEAHEFLKKNFESGRAAGLIRQYSSPWILEMIYEFERLGFEPLSGINLHQAMERAIKENNGHLHGVALRLKALQKHAENKSINSIMADLSLSEQLLEKSGDMIQSSKTKIQIARIELSRGNRKEAIQKAKAAWQVMGGYAEQFFPDDLHSLIDTKMENLQIPGASRESFDRYIELTENMFPVDSQEDVLTRVIQATNRFFGAERGGLFWFAGGKFTNHPNLRASCNLSEKDITVEEFKNNYDLILRSFKENQTVLKRHKIKNQVPSGATVRSILCLPVEVRGKTRAVIYHDNSYLEDCFDFLDNSTIKKVVDHVSRQASRIYEYYKIMEERNDLITEKTLLEPSLEEKGLIYKSRPMVDLVEQLDRVSQTDSTVLILGETGVGKELMARRVHAMSPRRDRPFVVVDATTIPETLFESELFGHEKGAFTGADHQKKGRLEIADRGTLFIDEIGELPLSIQVKLLRAIQEHSFVRVGGTRNIVSDFRLIAATNRDLAEEVTAKRFRQDLYYRLNVIPFKIPALRDRIEDIALLTHHFLSRFVKKYHRPDLVIDPETEKLLKQYDWPGNVRELENIIERAVLLSSQGRLEVNLPLSTMEKTNDIFSDTPTLDKLEQRYIQYILQKTNGKIGGPSGASQILGLKRTTMLARMKKLGMR
jgi:transcriptional regulator with GAF, ATPase, and Fis domain